jgi:hypothetical protein
LLHLNFKICLSHVWITLNLFSAFLKSGRKLYKGRGMQMGEINKYTSRASLSPATVNCIPISAKSQKVPSLRQPLTPRKVRLWLLRHSPCGENVRWLHLCGKSSLRFLQGEHGDCLGANVCLTSCHRKSSHRTELVPCIILASIPGYCYHTCLSLLISTHSVCASGFVWMLPFPLAFPLAWQPAGFTYSQNSWILCPDAPHPRHRLFLGQCWDPSAWIHICAVREPQKAEKKGGYGYFCGALGVEVFPSCIWEGERGLFREERQVWVSMGIMDYNCIQMVGREMHHRPCFWQAGKSLSSVSSYQSFFFGGGRGLTLAKQVLYHLSHSIRPFCIDYFWDGVSLNAWVMLDHDLLICASPLSMDVKQVMEFEGKPWVLPFPLVWDQMKDPHRSQTPWSKHHPLYR